MAHFCFELLLASENLTIEAGILITCHLTKSLCIMNDVEIFSILSPYYHNQSFILYVESILNINFSCTVISHKGFFVILLLELLFFFRLLQSVTKSNSYWLRHIYSSLNNGLRFQIWSLAIAREVLPIILTFLWCRSSKCFIKKQAFGRGVIDKKYFL